MAEVLVHQIYYSEETRKTLDPGFIPLDNSRNERADWREYWPIRGYLLGQSLRDEAFYGFLSPRFHDKTNLDSRAVYDFVRSQAAAADVVIFSPFFDQSAYYLNTFEQGASQHANILPVFRECVPLIDPAFDIDRAVMCSMNTVYCNFFVARGRFWKQWLQRCEAIFAIAERGGSDLAGRLNAPTTHGGAVSAPTKVFVIERVVSVMLASNPTWRVRVHNPNRMSRGSPGFELEQWVLDALKLAYTTVGHEQYLHAFAQIRQSIITRARQFQERQPEPTK